MTTRHERLLRARHSPPPNVRVAALTTGTADVDATRASWASASGAGSGGRSGGTSFGEEDAAGAGDDAVGELRAEDGVGGGHRGEGTHDRLAHRDAGALDVVAEATAAAAEAEGAAQLVEHRVELLAGAG